jgi:hypothetical protein
MLVARCTLRAWKIGSSSRRAQRSAKHFWVSHHPIFFVYKQDADTVLADAPNFMQMPLRVMAGYDNLVYGDGNKTSGGTDGLLFEDLEKGSTV